MAIGCHGVEALVLALPVEEVGIGDGAFHEVVFVVEERHQPIGIRIGQRVEQHRVHDGEDGGVGADAKRQRENRNRGEAWRPAQLAQSVAKILGYLRHNYYSVRRACIGSIEAARRAGKYVASKTTASSRLIAVIQGSASSIPT